MSMLRLYLVSSHFEVYLHSISGCLYLLFYGISDYIYYIYFTLEHEVYLKQTFFDLMIKDLNSLAAVINWLYINMSYLGMCT